MMFAYAQALVMFWISERQPVARYGFWNHPQIFLLPLVSRGWAISHSWPQVGPQVQLSAARQEQLPAEPQVGQREQRPVEKRVEKQVELVVLKAGVPWRTAEDRRRIRVAWQTSSGTDHAEGSSRMSGGYQKSAENTEDKGDNTPTSFWVAVLTISCGEI